VDASEYDGEKKKLEDICMPIMAKIYQQGSPTEPVVDDYSVD